MPTVAANPKTGETFVLVGNQWAPVTTKAANPNTGEMFGLVNNEWIPINAEAAKPEAGFWGALFENAKTLGLSDEATAFAANPNAQTRKAFIDAGESKYKHREFGEGHNWEALKELVGGSLGQLVAPVATGLAATPFTSPLGGLAAASAVSGTQYTTQNLLRQAQEQQAAIDAGKKPEETSVGKALVSAAGQTGLDLLGGPVFGKISKAFPFMRPLLGKLGGAAEREAGAILADAAEKGTISFTGSVAKGVGKGVAFEVPQEVAQQALERWQAGLSVDPFHDKGARDEYAQAALGALLLGGPMGAIEGGLEARGRPLPTPEAEPSAEEKALDDKARLTQYFEQRYSLDREEAAAQADYILAQQGLRTAGAPDVGGGQPDVSGTDGRPAVGEPAGEPAAPAAEPVGEPVVPTGEPELRQGAVEPALEETAAPPEAAPSAAPPAPEPNAIWANKDFDLPVTILPMEPQVAQDGRAYQPVSVDGKPSFVPADELRPLEPTPTPAAPEVAPAAAVQAAAAPQVAPAETVAPSVVEAPESIAPAAEVAAPTPVPVEKVTSGRAQTKTKTPETTQTPAKTQVEAAPAEEAVVEEKAVEPEAAPQPERAEPVALNVSLPKEAQDAQTYVNEVNPGFEVRFKEGVTRPYSYGIPGQKKAIKNFASVDALRKAILKEPMLKPKKVVEGVEVKQMPAAKARGLGARQNEDYQTNRDWVGGTEDRAGSVNRAMQSQIDLLNNEIDTSRRNREITDNERSRLVEMLQRPPESTLGKVENRAWLNEAFQQNELKKVTTEARALAKEQDAAKKAKRPISKELSDRIKDNTKRQNEVVDKLLAARHVIHNRVRIELAKFRQERKKTIKQLQDDFKAGKINERQFKIGIKEARPEPMRYRKGRGQAAGITLENLNNAVKSITDRWKVPLEPKLVQSVEDLPDSVRKEMEAADNLDAFGFLRGNTVYLIADNMHSMDDVAPALFHEALGHLGLQRAFREGLDDVLNDIYRTNKKMAAATDAWMANNPDAYASDEDPIARAVEEVLAEASEGGPLAASTLDKLVRYIKDFARRVLGLDLKFTDGEINTILAIAHEQAMEGEGAAVGSNAMRYSKPKTNAKVKAKLSVYEDEVTDGLKKTQVETSAHEMSGAIDSLLKANNINEFNDALHDNMRSIGDSMLDKMLYFFPASGVATLGEESGVRELHRILDLEAKMRGVKENLVESSAHTEKKLQKFAAKSGQKELGELSRLARRHRIDPYAFDTLEEAVANDRVLKRFAAMQKDPNTSAQSKRWKPKQIDLRIKKLREIYAARAKLDAQPGGKELYLETRTYFKDMHDMVRRLLDERVKSLDIDDASKKNLLNALQLEEEEALGNRKRPETESQLENDPYWDVPEEDLHNEYFPFMRHGDVWLRISSKASPLGRELYFFDTTTERNQFLRKRAKELGIDPNDGEHIKVGNKLDDGRLRDDLLSTDAVFRKIFSIVDKATLEGKYDTTQYGSPEEALSALKKQLGDDIYQTYLLTLPERSVRKSFIHANLVPGASADFVRTFSSKARNYSNQISKLMYARKIELALDDARKSIDSLSPEDQARGGIFIDNMTQHVKQLMDPPLQNKFTNTVNRGAFIWFLTSAATAFTQTSAVPIRVMPHLGARYGYAKSTAKFAKYMKVWDSLGTRHEEPDGTVNFSLPNVGDSSLVRSSKLAQRAYREGHMRRVFESTSVNVLKGEATPKTAGSKLVGRITENVYNALTGLFNMSEKVTREAAYMMTFELEHEKLMNERAPKTAEEREAIFQQAVSEAVKATHNTLGNYSDVERPLAMKGNLGRLLFLFKQYAVNTTKFFVGNLRRMFTKPGERWEAFKELSGVLLMGGMFHGAVGMPLYGVLTWALDLLMDPDDDDPETKALRAKENPYLADNSDARFRYQWLPSVFGNVTIPGLDGEQHSLSDVLANGPISELSDINIGSRTTFDGLWFRSGRPGDTPYQTAINTVLDNVAGLSWGKNFSDAIDLWQKGETLRGFEKVLPAAVKGGATAYRLATEGAETSKGDKMLKADKLTDLDLVAATLGFQPTKLAEIQKRKAAIKDADTKISKERAALFERLNKARMDPEGNREKIVDALERMVKFNRRYPYPMYEISLKNINDSYAGAMSQRKYGFEGLTPTAKELPYALPVMLSGQ